MNRYHLEHCGPKTGIQREDTHIGERVSTQEVDSVCVLWLPCCSHIGKLKVSKEVEEYVFEKEWKNQKVCHSAHDTQDQLWRQCKVCPGQADVGDGNVKDNEGQLEEREQKGQCT